MIWEKGKTAEDGGTEQIGRFPIGHRCSADVRKLLECQERRQVFCYNTLDVSALPAEEFKELSKVAEKTFAVINALYKRKTGVPLV